MLVLGAETSSLSSTTVAVIAVIGFINSIMESSSLKGVKFRDRDKVTKSVKQACTHCHRRKIRCDIDSHRTPPCSNCLSKKLDGCRVHEKKRPISARAHKSTLLPNLRPRTTTIASISQIKQNYIGSSDDVDTGNIAEFLGQAAVRAAIMGQQSRLCYIGTEPSNFHYIIRQNTQLPECDSRVLHFSNRQYNLKNTSYELQRLSPDAFARPDKNLESQLIDAYFSQINRGWPIVDEENFRLQLQGDNPRNALPLLLLNAVLVVGAHVLSREDQNMRQHQKTFFNRAKTLIDSRFEQDRVVYVQSALLLTWYADGLEEVVANGWYWIGLAARTAMGIGMHRDTTYAKLMPVQRRTWIRVWWVLFQFDTLMSLVYGRPQAINLDDCDVVPLESHHFEGIPHVDVNFCINYTQLCVLISHIFRSRWSLRRRSAATTLETISPDQQLAEFLNNLPTSLQSPLPSPSAWHATLHLTYNTIILLLHRPPPHSTGDSPGSGQPAGEAALCAEASLTISSLLERLQTKNLLQSLNFFGVHVIWTVMVHLKSELHSTNVLVVARSSRTLKALLAILLELSYSWNFARGLAMVFGDIEDRERGDFITTVSPGQEMTNDNDADVVGDSLFMDFGLLEDFLMGYEDGLA